MLQTKPNQTKHNYFYYYYYSQVLFAMYLLDAPYWMSRGLRWLRRLLLAGVLVTALAAALLAAGDLPALPLSVLMLLGVAFVMGARQSCWPLSGMDDAVWGKALGRTLWVAAVAVAVWWALWVSGCVRARSLATRDYCLVLLLLTCDARFN